MRGPRSVRYVLPEHVSTLLRQYRQRPGENETGGVLAGWNRKGCFSDTWTVSHFSLPSHKNKAGPRWFQLNRQAAQRFVSDVFSATNGTVYFCGFWHTHPEPYPTRSKQDKKVISDLFRNSKLEISTQLGLIVGTEGGIYAWCQRSDGKISENLRGILM